MLSALFTCCWPTCSCNLKRKIERPFWVHFGRSIVLIYFSTNTCQDTSRLRSNDWRCWLDGISFPEVFCKRAVSRNFAKFTGKHLCQSLFFNKVAGFSLQFYEKGDCSRGVFLWILWNTFFAEDLGRLLLSFLKSQNFWVSQKLNGSLVIFVPACKFQVNFESKCFSAYTYVQFLHKGNSEFTGRKFQLNMMRF